MKECDVKAICFSLFDVAILWKALYESEQPDLSSIGVPAMMHPFYQAKAKFAQRFVNITIPHKVYVSLYSYA